jgi:hypothetical protein
VHRKNLTLPLTASMLPTQPSGALLDRVKQATGFTARTIFSAGLLDLWINGSMAYALHIERLPSKNATKPTPIPLEDWKRALSAVQGVRLCTEKAYTITIPGTGEIVSFPHRDGDAEVYFSDQQKWHAVLSWFNGSASFKAEIALESLPNPVWTAAAALASQLGAVIRGDDGESYDLPSGEVIES